MIDLKKISKSAMGIPLRYILIFTLINMVFLLYFGNILIRLAFFALCVSVLYFFGRLPFADVDPVPFTTAVLFLFFDFPVAVQYAVWTCPAADAMTGNFNQWTFVTLASIILSLFISGLFPLGTLYFLVLFVVLYNLARLIITAYLGSLSGALVSTSTNTIIYLIISSALLPLIELGIKLF